MPDFKDFGEVQGESDGGHGGAGAAAAKGDPFSPVETPFSYDYYDSVTVAAKFPKKGPTHDQFEMPGNHTPSQMTPERKGGAGASHPSRGGKDAKSRSNKEDRT